MVMVPSSWLRTRSRTMDSPRLVAFDVEALGQARAVVADTATRELGSGRWPGHQHVAHPSRGSVPGGTGPVGAAGPVVGRMGCEGVLDGVLQQLGQHARPAGWPRRPAPRRARPVTSR